MPDFKFHRDFNLADKARGSLRLEASVTRGEKPSEVAGDRLQEEQEGILGRTRREVTEKRNTIKRKNRVIFRLKNELLLARGEVEPERTADGQLPGCLPDFLIIGVQKGGTSTLYGTLTDHPNVRRAANKELNFFNQNFERGVKWYRQCFLPPVKGEEFSLTGESTPAYFTDTANIPERAAKILPDARLILMLRNPVDRAYSNYQHQVRAGRETRDFGTAVRAAEAALKVEREGNAPDGSREWTQNGSAYISRGLYIEHLERWMEFFDREQLLILKSESFFGDAQGTLKRTLDFLGLPHWEPEFVQRRNQSSYKSGMDSEIREHLEAFFEPHNRRLYEYIGEDFGW